MRAEPRAVPEAPSEPIRILFTIPNFVTAGSGHAMWSIVSRLDRARFAPSIAVLKPGGALVSEIEQAGVPLFEAPFLVPPRPLATLVSRARTAARAFPHGRFDLWHSFHYLDDYTEPLVARFAGAKAWIYTKKNMSWNRRSWWLRSFQAKRVGAQNSDMIRNFFGPPMSRKKARLVPTSVDTRRFRPDAPSLGLRARLQTPPGVTVVGCVAQLVPVKGHPTLIEAVRRVPDVHLWVAGKRLDVEYADGLRRQVREGGIEDRVFFLDEIRDVPALLTELDVFALPTWDAWRMEGCPVALLEAMSAGRACVATDIPGSRDVVQDDGCGLLAAPRDPDSLERALRRLQADEPLRRRLGEAARRRILDHYAIEREVRDYEEIYSEALDLVPPR